MTKKYLPFIVLLAAALLLYYVKKNQRGQFPRNPSPDITVPAATSSEQFNRKAHTIIYSRHARQRMDCRHIDESEVMEILQNGQLNYKKIEEDSKGKKYPLEGITHDKQNVRIVFAPKQDTLVIVTVIDLGRDWDCGGGY